MEIISVLLRGKKTAFEVLQRIASTDFFFLRVYWGEYFQTGSIWEGIAFSLGRLCMCVSAAVLQTNFSGSNDWIFSLSEAIFSNYCLPPAPILCQHPAYPSQPASNPISFKRSSLRSPTSVRMNHFPSYSTFFITAPKAFTSRVNYLYLSLYSLLSCEPQKGMSLIFLCVSFNPVI